MCKRDWIGNDAGSHELNSTYQLPDCSQPTPTFKACAQIAVKVHGLLDPWGFQHVNRMCADACDSQPRSWVDEFG
jgi:hypothetical protein